MSNNKINKIDKNSIKQAGLEFVFNGLFPGLGDIIKQKCGASSVEELATKVDWKQAASIFIKEFFK